ncbi:putative autophagy-related protein 11 isoform X2 [Impatiens glandulifera]|uniref:putative autophagy-related protein 11 isoform X2 n=1 Tax=Impatiens glandulifera TaxID=253017 RepID=UPI001FB10946|nr:putative autophagy-related protein 11 isoform X2 [Impatiens glandulifera]XP_047327893.1 putative autophagy-related protein 11 isoform X2 [Impatiens glandulifera]
MSSLSSSSGSDSAFDIEELLQFQTRCEEKLELHVKTLSQTHTDGIKRAQDLERELRNCSQEIDYLQDQLNSRNEEVHSLVEHVHRLEIELVDTKILEEKVGSLKEELKSCNSERVVLEQELKRKEIELKKSSSLVERLEETTSSLAFMYQCETESMKLELLNLERNLIEAKKLQEEAVQEKTRMIELFQEAQKTNERLREENKEFKEKFQSVCGDDLGLLLSKLTIIGAPAGTESMDKSEKLSCHEYKILVEQLKEELKSEKLKAKEEAEDLAQEMAELRYHLTGLLEEECKRRARVEQISLQRITELEAQIQKEHKPFPMARHIAET